MLTLIGASMTYLTKVAPPLLSREQAANYLGVTPSPANDDAVVNNVVAFPTGEPLEAGKAGEGGDIQITNADFISAVFHKMPEGAYAAGCSKSGNPDEGGWTAKRHTPCNE
jgi:hypothetical protein